MSHWSQQAQEKGGKGMSGDKAGDPVHRCVEHVALEPVLDFNEQTILDPEIKTKPLPSLEPELKVGETPGTLEHNLSVHTQEGE